MDIMNKISECIIDGGLEDIEELVREAIANEYSAKLILEEGLLEGMNEVGDLFKDGEVFVPEVLISSETMNLGMEVIKPLLQEGDVKKVGTCVFATVKGDLHDIGKKLVMMMMEGAGFEIIDLGTDVSPEDIYDSIKEHKPDILCMSAMLTTTMASMKDTVELLEKEGLSSDSLDVMVGGAPVSLNFANSIGADYGSDASEAVEVARKILSIF
mgnify:CR=1 FL=1